MRVVRTVRRGGWGNGLTPRPVPTRPPCPVGTPPDDGSTPALVHWLDGLCLAVGLELLVVVSVFWALMVVVAWFAGQFVLVSLTLWDADWDLMRRDS